MEQCDLNHGEIGFATDFWVMLPQQDVRNVILCSGGFDAVKPTRLETYGKRFQKLPHIHCQLQHTRKYV